MEKILFISTVESHILNFHIPFINSLQHKGYEVHVATKLGEREFELRQLGVICHNINFSRSPYTFSNIIALKQLIKVMKSHRYSLVHVHTPMGSFLGRISAKVTNTKPILYTAHGFHFFKGSSLINWVIYYTVEKLLSRWTDGIITINSEDYQYAQNFKLRTPNSVFYVKGVGVPIQKYVSVNREISRKIRLLLGCTDEDVLLLFIAELNKGKNHIQAIRALKEVLKIKNNVYLVIVGEGRMASYLKKKAKKLDVGRNAIFLGYRKDIPELLSASDIFLFTSTREGLPRCIMEAMAAGKPIVATNIRGNRDLIANGLNGYLVPVNNVAATAQSILKLVNDKNLALKMGQEGQRMISSYSIDNILPIMDSIYGKFID